MSRWDPWRGCHRCSEGCRFCYIHKGDAKRGINTNDIVRSDKFNRPIEKKKNGEYKMAAGLVYLCFSSDFLLEDADEWRGEAWKIIKERSDCTFLFLTKRIERIDAVVVGGESDRNARPLNYDWVLSVREQCIRSKTAFSFRQCGTHFIKDGKLYTLNVRDLCSQARKAEIDYEP